MDEEMQIAFGRFGYEIAMGVLIGTVVTEQFSKLSVTKLVDDVFDHLLKELPNLEPKLREIAASATAQIEMVSIDADRLKNKRG